MVTPELSQYVQDQLATGVSADALRASLVGVGWAAADIDAALPATLPPVTHPKTRKPLIAMTVVLIIFAVIGTVYLVFSNRSATPNQSNSSTQKTATVAFTDVGIQFSYDATWKKVPATMLYSARLNTLTDAATPNEIQYYFYAPTSFKEVQTENTALLAAATSGNGAASSVFLQIMKMAYQADVSLTRLKRTSALAAARQATQSVCVGSTMSSSTTNPVIESSIQSTTVGQYKAYLLLPERGCDYQIVRLFIDGHRTVSTPTPTPVPGLIITGTTPSSMNDSFALNFTGAADIAHLSQSQKVILDSLQLP